MHYQSVAVVDAQPHKTIVWHVDVSTNPSGLSRMSGAWIVSADDTNVLTTLTRARYVTTTGAGRDMCRGNHAGVVDVAATHAAIASEIEHFQTEFEKAAAASNSKLIAPRWPRLPNVIDLANPPADTNAPAEVAVALGIARWLESLALVWESLETQRLMRKYLRGDDDDQRPFPISAAELDAAPS